MAASVNKVCHACGVDYAKPSRVSEKQWASRQFCSKACAGKKPNGLPEHEVEALYMSGLSSVDIAKIAIRSDVQIRRILKKRGVKMRPRSKAISMGLSKPEVRAALSIVRRRPCPEHVKDRLRAQVGVKSPLWRGGITKSAQGYLTFTSSPSNGENAGRTVHRVIGEWVAGRSLKSCEHVHHKDGDKLNNHPDNLQILSASEHAQLHAIQNNLGHRKNA
jgi:hypothetical protein